MIGHAAEIYDVISEGASVGAAMRRQESPRDDKWSWSCIDRPGRIGERLATGRAAARREFWARRDKQVAVSYTHLTLPTNREV